MSNALRKIIMQQLSHTNGEISNIIYNAIQNQNKMKYNEEEDWFEIEISELKTEYFKNHPGKKSGLVEGTNIFWKIASGKFIVTYRR